MAGFSILAKLGLDSSKFKKGIQTSDTALTKFGKAIGNVVKAGAAIAATAFTAFTIKGIKDIVEFDKKMSEVFTLLPGITKESMDSMSADTRNLATAMGVDLMDATNALYQAISAGVPKENVFEFMKVASKAAIGGVTSLEVAVDGLTSVINTYGRENITAKEAADSMFTAVKLGKTTFDELSGSLFNVLPIAKQANVKFDEISAALAVMTAKGTPTAVATTQLRQAITALIAPTTKTVKHFDAYRLSVGNLKALLAGGDGGLVKAMQNVMVATNGDETAIRKLVGSTEAMNAILTLTSGNAKSFGDAMVEMMNKTGAHDAAFKTMAQTVSHNLNVMLGHLKDLGMEFGAAFLPVINQMLPDMANAFKDLGPKVQKFAATFPAFIEDIGNMAKKFAGFAAAVGTFLIMGKAYSVLMGAVTVVVGLFTAATGAATVATTKLSAASKANVFGLAAAGAMAAHLAVKQWLKSQEDLHKVLKTSPAVLEKMKGKTKDAAEAARTAKDRYKELKEQLEEIAKTKEMPKEVITQLHDALELTKKRVEKLKEEQALFEDGLATKLAEIEAEKAKALVTLSGTDSPLAKQAEKTKLLELDEQIWNLLKEQLKFKKDIEDAEQRILDITKDRADEEDRILRKAERIKTATSDIDDLLGDVNQKHENSKTAQGQIRNIAVEIRDLMTEQKDLTKLIELGLDEDGEAAKKLADLEGDVLNKQDQIETIITQNLKQARNDQIALIKTEITEVEKLWRAEEKFADKAGDAAQKLEDQVAALRNQLKDAEAGVDEQRKFWNVEKGAFGKVKVTANKKQMREAWKEARKAGFKGTLKDFEDQKREEMRAAMKKRDDIIKLGKNQLKVAKELRELETKAREDANTAELAMIEKREALAKLEKETVTEQKKSAKELADAVKEWAAALAKIQGKKIPVTIDTSALDKITASIRAKDGGVAGRLDGGGTSGAETHQHDITVNLEGVGGGGGEADITLPPIPSGEDTELSLESTQIEVLDTLKGYFVNQ